MPLLVELQEEIDMEGYLFIFFFAASFGFLFFLGSWFYICFPASLLFCFLLFLLLCLSAFLLFVFPAFCFSCFSAFQASLLCFCASVPFNFYYSTFSFLQSCVFAALLPAPLLLCFLSVRPLFFFPFFFALFSPSCILNETLKTLGETQRNPKEILIRTPDKGPQRNHKLTLKKPWMKP